jgi:Na+-driven multidrug efflux pump
MVMDSSFSATTIPCRSSPLQGCFRGLQDTRTPFYATLAANALNIGGHSDC